MFQFQSFHVQSLFHVSRVKQSIWPRVPDPALSGLTAWILNSEPQKQKVLL